MLASSCLHTVVRPFLADYLSVLELYEQSPQYTLVSMCNTSKDISLGHRNNCFANSFICMCVFQRVQKCDGVSPVLVHRVPLSCMECMSVVSGLFFEKQIWFYWCFLYLFQSLVVFNDLWWWSMHINCSADDFCVWKMTENVCWRCLIEGKK